ncbi:MAG: hypothetical protein B7X12_10155, partial [Halothiobacillus sp. 20-53-49]
FSRNYLNQHKWPTHNIKRSGLSEGANSFITFIKGQILPLQRDENPNRTLGCYFTGEGGHVVS